MTVQTFLQNVGAILAVMAVLSLVELAVPLFTRDEASRGRRRANLGLTLLTFALNWALTSAAMLLAVRMAIDGQGLLSPRALPMPVLIGITFVTLDLCTYLAHRSMHALPFMWRIHRVHHSDPFLDATSSFRQHPIEGLWRFAWIIVPVWALGVPPVALLAYRLTSAIQAVLEHANIRTWRWLDRSLAWLWVTPNMHKVHHSRELRQTNSNYGNIFAFFDRALGTFRSPAEALGVRYGLDDVDPRTAKSFVRLLGLPFIRRSRPSLIRPEPQPQSHR